MWLILEPALLSLAILAALLLLAHDGIPSAVKFYIPLVGLVLLTCSVAEISVPTLVWESSDAYYPTRFEVFLRRIPQIAFGLLSLTTLVKNPPRSLRILWLIAGSAWAGIILLLPAFGMPMGLSPVGISLLLSMVIGLSPLFLPGLVLAFRSTRFYLATEDQPVPDKSSDLSPKTLLDDELDLQDARVKHLLRTIIVVVVALSFLSSLAGMVTTPALAWAHTLRVGLAVLLAIFLHREHNWARVATIVFILLAVIETLATTFPGFAALIKLLAYGWVLWVLLLVPPVRDRFARQG